MDGGVAVFDQSMQLSGNAAVSRLEAFFGALVGVMTISFGVMYFKADCPTAEVLAGVAIPRMQYALNCSQCHSCVA